MTTENTPIKGLSSAQFSGRLVRLAVIDPERDLDLWVKWMSDSEFQQLQDWGPSNLHSRQEIKEWMEKPSNRSYNFSIHTLADDQIIGSLSLDGFDWAARDAWLGIGIGEHDYWGKGCGTDAMAILLRFAFESLNLNRISLDVFEYNQRAIRTYEKLGFQHEGRQRQLLNRFGRRWDLIYMGLLRADWEQANPALAAQN
jgi:RimJ/RimL family protein N-acetyltransferase